MTADTFRLGAVLTRSPRLSRGPDEKSLQDLVEKRLSREMILYHREFRLAADSTPDFFLPESGVVVEVKLKVPSSVFPQLLRYAQDPRVRELVVVSWQPPPEPLASLIVDGAVKPVYYIPLWRCLV